MRTASGFVPSAAWTGGRARPVPDGSSWAIALVAAGLLAAAGAALVEQLAHWFLAPVLACGVIIGRDAVDWLRGRVDLFDPVGVLGLLGLHLFFLAPVLHAALGVWMPYVEPPPDWRDWLGWMAVVNAGGLIAYRLARSVAHRLASGPPRAAWVLDHGRCWPVIAITLAVTTVAQAVVYRLHGGLLGYVGAAVAHDPSFEGMGWLFMISERFPIVAMLGVAILARRRARLRRWSFLVPALAAVFLAQLLFGGLRGSRSMMVWTMFWALGMVHVWVRPLSRRMVAAGIVALLVFMYGYGLYKGAGLEALQAWRAPELARELEEETGRTLSSTLLGDLGRSDVQAYLLFRLSEPGREIGYAWGRTYAGGVSLLIPKALWPDRPPTKEKEGTEALYGRGAYAPGSLVASNVYGLGGEGLLNFGPLGALAAFALLGIAVGIVRARYAALVFPDVRWLFYPYLVNACIVALIGDSDNLVFFLVSDGLVPILVIAVCTRRWRPAASAPVRAGGRGR
jgi:hypothetical protein